MSKFIYFSKKQKSTMQIMFACFAWMLFALNANAQLVNIPVTGFNNDIIANGVGLTNSSTSGTIPGVTYPSIGVDGGGYSFIDGTYQYYSGSALPSCYLPAGGAIPSALASTTGLTYQLQSYSANNALTVASNTYAGSVHPTSGTVALVTPASYGNMYVLYESVMNTTASAPTVTATVTFADGSTQVFSNILPTNWFNNVNRAYATSISRANNAAPGAPDVCTGTSGPYLFQMTFAINSANYSKQVQSISFNWSAAVGTTVNTVEYLHVLALGGMAPCVAPSSQPTALTLTSTSPSQISGSFTPPAIAPSGYLVVRYNAGTLPTNPVNGTTYTVGQTIGTLPAVGTVISVGNSTSFMSTGLTNNTTYDYYVYAYNNTSCVGGSTYNPNTISGENLKSITTNSCGSMPTVITVGPTGNYPSLSGTLGVLAAIEANGISAPTTIELQSNYSAVGIETYPITINYSGCFTSSNTLTIRPEGSTTSPRIISSANTTATFDLNGARNVTIDGRPTGSSTGKFLVIENTSSAVNFSGNAILLRNDASNNTLTNLEVRAANINPAASGAMIAPGATPGAIAITTTNKSSGNDNNIITECDVHSVSTTGNLNVGIYAASNFGAGTSQNNDNLTISNCNIYDFFHPTTFSAGINIAVGSNNFTITNNHLYQTVPRIITSTPTVRVMWITPNTTTTPVSSASGFVVTGNFIGGRNSSGTGGAYTISGSPFYTFTAMDLNFGIGTPSSVQNNTITNMELYGAFSSSSNVRMIDIANGNVNVGTVTGNLIGSTTQNGAIKITTTSNNNTLFYGLRTGGGNIINISNNIISGIDFYGTPSNIATGFTMIANSGGSNVTISNNTIGSLTLANSINAVSPNSTSGQIFSSRGILVNGSTANAVCLVSNNTISNINSNNAMGTTSASSLIGIAVTSTACTVTGNTIINLTSAGRTTAGGITSALMGISFSSPTAPAIISGNTIHSLKLTNDTTIAAIKVCGLYFNNTPGATNLIERNFIHSLSISSPSDTATITGIDLDGGQVTVQNNMIRLGLNDTGANITQPCYIRGIRKGANISNLWFNSIYIGGTNVGSKVVPTYALLREVNAVDNIRNNVFVNNRSNASSTGGTHYSVKLNSATTLTMDYNDYFGTGTGYKFGALGTTDFPNYLNSWIPGDANSFALDPAFANPDGNASTVDLHISSSPSIVESTGIAIATVTNDYDNNSRAAFTPTDMGADAGNFNGLVCNGTPLGGTSSVTQPGALCFNGTKTLTLSGFSNLPGVTCQWQQSATPGGPYANVIGGTGSTTPVYTTAVITSTTYYVCVVTCSNGGASSLSTESEVIVNNPTVMQTVPANRCGAGTVTLNATQSTGAILNWYNVATGGSVIDTGSTFTTPVITSNTNYWVSAIIGTCESARTMVAATIQSSILITPSASLSAVCFGNSSEVSVSSANDPNYKYTWTSIPTGFTATGPGPHAVTPGITGTTYQVYAFDSTTQCGALSNVTVNTTPNNLISTTTATPSGVCYGGDAQLNVNAGVLNNARNYGFSASSGTYTALVGATAAPNIAANASVGASNPFTIGFSFQFAGIVYDTVQVTPQGTLLFGSGKTGNVNNNLATATTTLRPGVAPLWDELRCSSGIKYQLSGTTGNRVLTVEWTEMKWTYFAVNAVISFQVKLYEGSNAIQFVYKQEATAVNNGTASIGIMGTASTDFISLQNSGTTPTISTTVAQNSINAKPATGQVYTFTPPAAASFTYDWTGSNLSSTTITNPTVQNITGSETFHVLITDVNNGCTRIDSATVEMFQTPSVYFTTDLSNFYCENQNINFSANATGYGPGAQTFSWTGPGFTSGAQNPTIYGAQVSNSGDYTVNFTDGNGCTATQTQYVEVNPNPVVSVTTTQNACLNDNSATATFDITVQPTYNDYAILEGSNSGSSNPQTFTNYADGFYFYQVSELNTGCTSFGSFDITTAPNMPPVISCQADITIANSTGMCGAYVNYTVPVGTDNCANGLVTTLEAGPASGGWFPIGTTVVRYRATDDQGAFTECTFNVIVNDNEFPSYLPGSTCPANITSCNPVTWTAPLFQDNCPGLQVTSTHTPGGNFPLGVTPVTYTATDLKGNVTSCTFNVTVLDSSVEATSITSNRDFNNICSGGDITLTVNGGHLGESAPGVPAQWKWYSGSCGTTLVGTGSSITVAPTSTTTYFVRAEGGCRNTNCVQLTVVVNIGAPTVTPVYTTIPAQGAPGVTDILSVAPVAGATYYRWFTNNGHINSVLFNGNVGPWETNVPTVNVSFVLPEQNYQLRVIAGNACGRTNQSNTTIRGTVPAPTSMNGPVQACPGAPVTYTIAAIPNGSPVTYNWTIVPVSAGTITVAPNGLSASVNFNTGFGSAQVCANGISSFGLPGASYCTTVTSSAPVPGAISGNPAPCSGNTTPEIYSITSVAGAVTYNWTCSVPGAIVVPAGNGLSASISFPAATFTGSVQVTASSTCGTSSPSVLNINNGIPGNPGDIIGATGGLCGAQDAAFSVTTSNALSYQWTVTPGMSIDGVDNLNAVTIDFLSGFTSGTVTVEAFYACGSVIKTHSVSGAPSAPIVAPAALCANSFQTYFITNLEPSTDYTWTTTGDILDQYCSVGSSSNCTGYYIETGAGGGSFTVTSTNACGTATATSDPCRVMAEAIDMKLFPNPTSGLVTVEIYSKMGGNYKVSITDLSGRQIFNKEFIADSGRNQQEIDLGFANTGIYMVYIKDANGNIGVQKLSVQ